MSVDNFIDTNVFIYLFDKTDSHKRQSAEKLVQRTLDYGTGCISYQVVQETINIMTRKLSATAEEARQLMDRVLMPLWRINPTQMLYQLGLDLQARYRYGFYDSLILAAALEAGCTRLYSEDLQDGQKIEGLTIENPFHDY